MPQYDVSPCKHTNERLQRLFCKLNSHLYAQPLE